MCILSKLKLINSLYTIGSRRHRVPDNNYFYFQGIAKAEAAAGKTGELFEKLMLSLNEIMFQFKISD